MATAHATRTLATTRRRRAPRRALTSPWAYVFLLPALLIFGVFTIWPTIYSVIVSLYRWNWLNPDLNEFIGGQNYLDVIQGSRDPNFWTALGVSAYYALAMVVLGTVLALAFAFLLRATSRILYVVRTTMFLAHITPLVATSIVWVWIFNPRYGLANLLLHTQINWLMDANWAMPSVVIYSLWHELGFTTLVFLGGLATLSSDLSEAARIDGASWWQEFRYVTLPQLRPFVVFVIVISSVASLQAFTQFYVMTGGGPGYATTTLGVAVYQAAFADHKTGYAAALAVVLFVMTGALSVLQLLTSRRMGR